MTFAKPSFAALGPRPLAFLRDQRGVVALMFGLMLLPMLGAVGLAIDFGAIMTVRTKAQTAADAAALQASGVARDLIKSKDASEANTKAALADAKTRAEMLFDAHAQQSRIPSYTRDVTITRDGQTLTSTVSFTVETTNFIGRVFGRGNFTAVGKAAATSSLPTYIDVYLALDVSQSMGLAATAEDGKKLFSLTYPNCTFGCHQRHPDQLDTDLLTFEQTALQNNVKLRVDVLRDAVKRMIAKAQVYSQGDAVYRFGLYTMSLDASLSTHALNKISAISGDFGALNTKADMIGLSANNNSDGLGDSFIDEQIDSLKSEIPASGSGESQASSKKYLFVVTDGARDRCGNSHCMGVVDASYCNALKTAPSNVTVGVLYTTFLPIYKDPNDLSLGLEDNYARLVSPIAAAIAPALQNCASPDWFFEASDGPAIELAAQKMFEQTSQAPALTD